MPSPEALGERPPPASRRVVTFRLDDAEHEALLGLADRASLGPSAFARLVVEAYIQAHAPASNPVRNKRSKNR